MTRDELIRLVEHWRRRLCPEWQAIISFEEPPPDDEPDSDDWVACVHPRPETGETVMYFRDAALENDERGVARIVVHELLHPLLDRVLDFDEALKPYCGDVQWEIYQEQRRVPMEEFINRMAHAIVDGGARVGTIEGQPRGA